MAKELPYFKFEPSEWQNGNVQMCTVESRILFIDICCSYWQRLGDLPYAFALQKHCGGIESALQELCDNEILHIKDNKICIEFLDEQLGERYEKSTKASKSAHSRWSKTKNANASKTQCENDAKRKEEKREEDTNKEQQFNLFWERYEKKGTSKKAKERFMKLTDEQIDKCFEVVDAYVLSTPDKQYRKGLESWILNECWNDVVTVKPEPKKTVEQTYYENVMAQVARDEAREAELKNLDQ